MTESSQYWKFDELPAEARHTAEKAAEAAGLPLDTWLNQLIKYVSAMELKGDAPVGDNGFGKAIEAMATAQDSDNRNADDQGADNQYAGDQRATEAPDAAPEAPPYEHRHFEHRHPDDLLPGEKAWPGDDISDESGAPFEFGPSREFPSPESMTPSEFDPPPGDWPSEDEAPRYDEPPPSSLPPELISPSRFEAESPHERDIESAIGSWRKAGSLVPVVVRPDGRKTGADEKRRYEIITGAERWHAAKRLKMKRVPVAVTTVSDDELLRVTLIERLRRRSLSAIEEAQTYKRILTTTERSVVGLASDIGCAPSQITSALQLLDLPGPVQSMIEDSKLTVLHARALLQADDPEAVANEVVARRLDIYQTEQLARNPARSTTPAIEPDYAEPDYVEPGRAEPEEAEPAVAEPDERETAQSESEEDSTGVDMAYAGRADESLHEGDAEIHMIEENLSRLLGIKVLIEGSDAAGVLSLHYGGEQSLRDLVLRLNREAPRS